MSTFRSKSHGFGRRFFCVYILLCTGNPTLPTSHLINSMQSKDSGSTLSLSQFIAYNPSSSACQNNVALSLGWIGSVLPSLTLRSSNTFLVVTASSRKCYHEKFRGSLQKVQALLKFRLNSYLLIVELSSLRPPYIHTV